MSGKYGSSSFSILLADGYNLLAAKVQGVTHKVEALQQRSDGLGDTWEATTPTGLRKGMLTQSGAFFDDATASIHDAWKTHMQGTIGNVYSPTSRIVCVGWAGNVIGRMFRGLQGAFGLSYEVLGKIGNLTEANVAYTITGQVNEGVILQEWATRTDDWSTRVENHSVDNGASSANGGVGYLQVTGFAGPNSITCKVRHSDDNVTFTDLIAFTAVTGAQTAQRVTVSGTIKRYLEFSTLGFGNVSPSASTSASRSPSVSASASASPSLSPSASISPSGSTSLSPSSSISPSASTSRSPSSSLSPSVSASASASPSLSPSTSTSPSASASPSAGAGPASSITVFCGFARL